MSKVFFVTGHFATPGNTTSRILTKIACALSLHRDVAAIAACDADSDLHDEEIRSKYGIDVQRIGKKLESKDFLPFRLLYSLKMSRKMISMLNSQLGDDDDVIIVTNPELLMLTAGRLRHRRKFRLCFLVHDVFPENALAAGIFSSPANPLYKFVRRFFNRSYARADRIIVIGEDMKKVVEKKVAGYGATPEICVIPNFPGTASCIPGESPEILPYDADYNGPIRVVYAGNIGRVQGLSEFLDIWLSQSNPDVELHLFGGGVFAERISQKIECSGRKDIVYHGPYFPEEQDDILCKADICLVTLAKGMYGLAVPSKSYNTLAAGRPVIYIGDEKSEIWNVVDGNRLGVCFSPDDKDSIRNFIAGIRLSDRQGFAEMGRRASIVCSEQFSEKIILKKYTDLFCSKQSRQ